MTAITDMALPDEVVREAYLEATHSRWHPGACESPTMATMRAAIRAALQAMVDCGMATVTYGLEPRLTIRLDADARKRTLQEDRK